MFAKLDFVMIGKELVVSTMICIGETMTKFWKSFRYFDYAKYPQSARIDGHSNDYDIACRFADFNKTVYELYDRNQSSVLSSNLRDWHANKTRDHANDSLKLGI